MNKDKLLKETIKVKISTELTLEYKSINELVKAWYEDYRDGLEEFKNITYKGKLLEIVYSEVFDDEGESIEETDFITIKESLQEQIIDINLNNILDEEVIK